MSPQAGTGPRILLLGASGFLGAQLQRALVAAGFDVTLTTRGTGGTGVLARVDFSADHDVQTWLPRLQGMDIVINSVGIFAEHGRQSFDAIHVAAPRALFQACVQAGVKHVMQFSALGAASGITPYLRSKRDADEFLMALPMGWTILRPSLVYGEAGTSSRFFRRRGSRCRGTGRRRCSPSMSMTWRRLSYHSLLSRRVASSSRWQATGPSDCGTTCAHCARSWAWVWPAACQFHVR
jgi:uncharacterized protein YbjT (DUF2867 family)